MGHNDGTQSPLEPMPKHPHILKRTGRYYYRKRIPTDLVQAGCYGKKKEIKRALGANNLTKANSLAQTVALEVQEEFIVKRRELEQSNRFAKCAKSGGATAKRKLSDLTDIERRDFILRAFIASEKQQAGVRAWNPDNRTTYLETAREDLAAIEGSPHFEEPDWLEEIRALLDLQGISHEGTDDATLRPLADKLRRAAVESAWRTERAISGSPYDSRDSAFAAFHADSPLPAAAKPSKTIGDLCADYIAHNLNKARIGLLAKSTIPKIEMRSRILTDFFGEGKAVASLTREDAARLVDFLPTLPQNAAKRYKGVSVVTAAERESKLPAKRLIHSQTADDYLTGLSAMLSFAVQNGWLQVNPLENKLVRERLAKPEKRVRQPLSPDQMAKVFSSPDFLAQRSGQKDKLEARYWLPLLCLFHGTRSNEVAGMRVADVEEADGIAFLNLRENTTRRLKNETSARRVPLHKMLVEMGFLEFVARRREKESDGPLFTGLSHNRNAADGIGKWWHRLVTGVVGDAPANAATGACGIHSLRHSWAAAARATGLSDSIVKLLGGWSQASAFEGYGPDELRRMLKKAIDKIEFPGVDFSALLPTQDAQ